MQVTRPTFCPCTGRISPDIDNMFRIMGELLLRKSGMVNKHAPISKLSYTLTRGAEIEDNIYNNIIYERLKFLRLNGTSKVLEVERVVPEQYNNNPRSNCKQIIRAGLEPNRGERVAFQSCTKTIITGILLQANQLVLGTEHTGITSRFRTAPKLHGCK